MINYKVVKGDTLSDIASRFGTSISALVRANGLKNANKIQAGRNLIIPDAPKAGDLMPLDNDAPETSASVAPHVTVLDPVIVTGIRPDLSDWLKAPKVYWLIGGALLILLTTDDN